MMRAASLVLTVTAMTGLPKPLIKAPAAHLQHLEVLPSGSVAAAAPASLVEGTTGKAAFARGRAQASEEFTDNLVESRQIEEVERTFERSHALLERNEVGVTPPEEFAEQHLEDLESEVKNIQDEATEISTKSVDHENMEKQEEEAEAKSRDAANAETTEFSTLQTQANAISQANEEQKDMTAGSAESTSSLQENERTENRGMSSVEGELDLLKARITELQGVVASKLDEISTGTEKLYASGYAMTDGLNRNGNFLKELVHTLSETDGQAVREVDATVELLRQIHLVDMAKGETFSGENLPEAAQ